MLRFSTALAWTYRPKILEICDVICFDDLPIYLQKSIREYQENKNDKYHWDIYYDDLYGSINSAQHGGELTKEEADWLREEYLYK